jgi:hypothetical protein
MLVPLTSNLPMVHPVVPVENKGMKNTYCISDSCENEAIVGLGLCEQHAEECTCRCADCERRGVHYCHAEDASDYGAPCHAEVPEAL